MSSAYVISHAMVSCLLPMGIVDSAATEHIARLHEIE